MRRPQGYATFVSPDAPVVERDTAQCCHCSTIIFVKPGSATTVYLIPQLLGPDREEPGASCYNCMKPVCLRCHAKGRCLPFERKIERMEARSRLRRAGRG
jgi:hypothetical protein